MYNSVDNAFRTNRGLDGLLYKKEEGSGGKPKPFGQADEKTEHFLCFVQSKEAKTFQ